MSAIFTAVYERAQSDIASDGRVSAETKRLILRYGLRAALAALLLIGAPARGAQCNLSWCVDPGLPTVASGQCPDGITLDFAGNPRQLRWGSEFGCPVGAWGFGVTDPATEERVPVFDRLVECEELARLCPAAPIHPGGTPPPAPILMPPVEW